MFYPKGILSQSADAKSTKYNATIGMATNDEGKMYADSLNNIFNELTQMKFFHMHLHKVLKTYVTYGKLKC